MDIDNPFDQIKTWEQYHAGTKEYQEKQDEEELRRKENTERAWALRFENDTQDLY
jgi:hypothetical protein|tara:strand:- start:108 stop:272 length:165 start_codon:yes stop_codon:yes gene_type:complete